MIKSRIILLSTACVMALSAEVPRAQQPAAPRPIVNADPQTMALWENGAPGALGTDEAARPTLTLFRAEGRQTPGASVIVAPGGGYGALAVNKEGRQIAYWFNSMGVTAFVLKYRLGPAYHHPIELGDAQRAIRIVRANAAEYGVAENHVGMWGFSAGGHLTATAGTHFDTGRADAADGIEKKESRPDFLILAYPVITLMDPSAHAGSRKYLLGENQDPALVQSLSAETQVTSQTPPTFLFSTTDDKTVPIANSVIFYEALVKAGVPAEIHIFQQGAHGAGLAPANPQLDVWPDLLIKWMRERGYAANPQ